MAKRKMTPLAQALSLTHALTPDDLATLADYIRTFLPATPRKPVAKKVGKKAQTTAEWAESKGEKVVLPDDPEGFLKGASA